LDLKQAKTLLEQLKQQKSVVIAGSVGFEQEDVAIGGSDICACG